MIELEGEIIVTNHQHWNHCSLTHQHQSIIEFIHFFSFQYFTLILIRMFTQCVVRCTGYHDMQILLIFRFIQWDGECMWHRRLFYIFLKNEFSPIYHTDNLYYQHNKFRFQAAIEYQNVWCNHIQFERFRTITLTGCVFLSTVLLLLLWVELVQHFLAFSMEHVIAEATHTHTHIQRVGACSRLSEDLIHCVCVCVLMW